MLWPASHLIFAHIHDLILDLVLDVVHAQISGFMQAEAYKTTHTPCCTCSVPEGIKCSAVTDTVWHRALITQPAHPNWLSGQAE